MTKADELRLLCIALTACGNQIDSVTVTSNSSCRDSKGIYHLPNPVWTPGAICTSSDPNFDGYRYPAHIAHCKRNISLSEKDQVAKLYGISKSDYSKYEFDHLIPLNSGGSNDITNLWPQPLDEAKDKDIVEDEAYNALRKGIMTQQQAIDNLHAWKPTFCK
jgi:hypothetical protein